MVFFHFWLKENFFFFIWFCVNIYLMQINIKGWKKCIYIGGWYIYVYRRKVGEWLFDVTQFSFHISLCYMYTFYWKIHFFFSNFPSFFYTSSSHYYIHLHFFFIPQSTLKFSYIKTLKKRKKKQRKLLYFLDKIFM